MEKLWNRGQRLLHKVWRESKTLILKGALYLYEKCCLLKAYVERNIEELLILVKLLMLIGMLAIGMYFYIEQHTFTWSNLFTCSHWIYFAITAFVIICCVIIVGKKIRAIYTTEFQHLQEGYQELTGSKVSWLEVWLRVIERYNNLLNSIWDTFMGLLLPSLLLLYGYSIVVSKHIDFKDMLGVSMTIISVLLALLSLAFARDVKRESDKMMQQMMDKLNEVQSVLDFRPSDGEEGRIVQIGA